MNHTFKGILIVAAITSMMVLGATTIPIMQNASARSTNTNTNTNTADSSSSSDATASNTNNINNTATASQSQEQDACAVAVTCQEGTTTVTPPPTTTCNPSTVGGQTATPTDDTCTATIPFSAGDEATGIFRSECNSIQGGNVVGDLRTQEFICTFPSTPPT
jgi:cytoskeletal protein RodZ